MGHDARKPDLVACKQQMGRLHSLISFFVIHYSYRLIAKLATCKMSKFLLVSVAEHTGFLAGPLVSVAEQTGFLAGPYHLGLVMTKPVFNRVRFKPPCLATETSWKIGSLLVVSLDMVLSNKRITKALIRLCACAGWSAPFLLANTEDRFFVWRPI